jgi:hypothetical protein
MDDSKIKQIKRQMKLNELVKNVIKENTDKIKMAGKIFEKEKNITAEENKKNFYINKTENRMPYVLFGFIESEFIVIDEKENLNQKKNRKNKFKETGCGLLIENNIVLIQARNLIYDENKSMNNERIKEDTEKDLMKSNKLNKDFHSSTADTKFKLNEIFFIPVNISDKYKSFLPNRIKIKDYYSPLLECDMDTTSDEEKLLNSWGIAILDFPLGEFIKFILNEEENDKNILTTKKRNKNNNNFFNQANSKNYANTKSIVNSKINSSKNNSISSFKFNNQIEKDSKFIEIKSIDNMDLFNSDIFFL